VPSDRAGRAGSPDVGTATRPIDAISMTEPESALAVLFADVSGSTRLYETLGDSAAHRIVAQLLAQLREVIASEGGRVVKTIGDEVMATFDEAGAAVTAARAMQREIARAVRSPDAPAGIRIGVHSGPVLEEAGDVFGDTVNVAARMVSLAKVGQILTSGETLDRTPARSRGETRHVDRTRLHGRGEELEVFEVLWGRDSVTSDAAAGPSARALSESGARGIPREGAAHDRPRRGQRPGARLRRRLAPPCAHRVAARALRPGGREHERHPGRPRRRPADLRAP
jgi:class 3 adenylate cyclase